MKRLSTWLLFWGSAALLLVIVAGYAEATNEWQQVSGNSTTALTGGCNAATTGFCTGVPTINESSSYYFIVGAAFDSPPGAGSVLANVRDPVSGLRHFAVTSNGVVESLETGGTAALVYHQNVSSTLIWAVVEFVPASTATARMDGFNSAVKHPLQGWTETGTTGLYHRYSSNPSSTTVGYLFEANNTPGAPVLTGQIVESRNVLTWTTPAGTITGYNITRTDVYGTYVAHVGLVNTWDEGSTTRNRSYTVTAWGPGGNGTPSNVVTLQLPPVDLFGDTGAIYGGNKTVLAAAVGVPELGLDLLMSLLLILVFTVAGIMLTPAHRLIGGGGGAVAGLFITLANDLIPIWVLVFMVAAAAAGFLLIRRRSRGGMP